MPTSVRPEVKHKLSRKGRFGAVYFALLLLTFHWAIVAYVNSTFLEQFVSTEAVGALYTIGSALTIFALLLAGRALKTHGNYKITVGLTVLEFLVLLGLALADDMRIVVPLFIIHHALVPLLLFNIDVFVENLIGDNETETGGRRGLLLVIMASAIAVAPLVMGIILGPGEPRFPLIYLSSAFVLFAFAYLVINNFKSFRDPPYHDIDVLATLRQFWRDKDMRFVFLAHFLLQIFFAWMVIYVPLYLASTIGFEWDEIGLILFVCLMAYVLFEYPIGEISDRYIGEKEMMAVGFLIMAVTTGWLSFLHVEAIVPWAVALFLTRIGASLVEATTESYFFKHTSASDANVISFFRITRPLSFVTGALLGSVALLYLPFSYIFLALGICLLPGIAFSYMLKDTR